MACLTSDDRLPPQLTADFLYRIERDDLIGDGEMSWSAWEQAAAEFVIAASFAHAKLPACAVSPTGPLSGADVFDCLRGVRCATGNAGQW